ncbi:aminoacyl-tRNA hydrolase [Myxococcota bacterium]|nr:aminoacyl-tRNA hydrolase [Myxococcota bacterium]
MATELQIRPGLSIPLAEIQETASRAGGPGGQHVNKASTRATLRWNVLKSQALTTAQRQRIVERLSSRITRRGEIVVHADRFRSRARNRELARERLAELVRSGLSVPRDRVGTRPTRSSRERALAAKKHRGTLKAQRSRPTRDD